MFLQGCWFDTSLHLWAARPGERPEAGLRLLSAGELRALVGEISTDGLLGTVATESQLRLVLPGAAEAVDGYGGLTAVPSLRFAPADSADLLTSLALPAA